MKKSENLDYKLYFDSKAWLLNPEQIQEIVKKIKLKEKLMQMPPKNKVNINKKI